MTLTTHVRFLAPIDPREVFQFAAGLVNAPEGFRFGHRDAGYSPFDGYPANPRISAEHGQGANALIYVEYGKEGSMLVEYEDEEFADLKPPPAYVDLSLDTPYGYRDEHGRNCGDLHAVCVEAIALWSPVGIAWELEYDGSWYPETLGLFQLGHSDGALVQAAFLRGKERADYVR